MKHAKVDIYKYANKLELFNTALQNCYSFHVDELDCDKSYARQPSEKSFIEVMGIALNSKECHWTALFRGKVYDGDVDFWEFGLSTLRSPDYFFWIKVRPDLAENIFLECNLQIIEY